MRKISLLLAVVFCLFCISCKEAVRNEVSVKADVENKGDVLKKMDREMVEEAKVQQELENKNITFLSDGTRIELVIPTFLGNEKRNLNGIGTVPEKLKIAWKVKLGCGHTGGFSDAWCGSGWTGQSALVTENDKPFIIQSAYDWNLRKINAETGEVIWKYQFDDIIKSSPSVVINHKAKTDEEKILVISGSRAGYKASAGGGSNPSLRGISYLTGRELWRFSMDRTDSYSRDCDGSAIMIDDLIYIGLENGYFVILDPNQLTDTSGGFKTPKVVKSQILYSQKDRAKHGGNLVTEASVAKYKDTLFISAGSGHIYQLDSKTLEVIWDFYTGSDIDGSTVVSDDGFVYAAIERQYIPGRGGVFKLNPENQTVEWFFPTENSRLAEWEGGIIGSVTLNQERGLVAFTAIDRNLYVISDHELDTDKAIGPDAKTSYPKPKMYWKKNVGGAISTPIFVDDYLISAGYGGIYLFKIGENPTDIRELDHISAGCESTPMVYKGRIFVGSRDGYLYCFKN